MMHRGYTIAAITVVSILGLSLACDFNPMSSSFQGFDGKGSRISGTIVSEGTSAQELTASPQKTFQDMKVQIKQDPSVASPVKSNGTFTLVGIPDGRVTLVFLSDVHVLGEIPLDDVRPNQEIRITVELTIDLRIRLLSEDRDNVDFSVSCAKSPSFWCRAANGSNTVLTRGEFDELASKAADMLSGVPGLERAEDVADAVCRRNSDRDQFLRELAALALNLAAGLDDGAALDSDAGFSAIGDAFDAAVDAAKGGSSPGSVDDIHDVIESINDNDNTAISSCEDDGSQDDAPPEDSPSNDNESGTSSGG